MKKTTNKILSIILSVLLLFSVIPMTVFATGSVASVTTVSGAVTEYADLTEAFYAAAKNAGSTVTLLSNVNLNGNGIEISEYTGFTSADFTLELNGNTISSSVHSSVLSMGENIIITIKDSVGAGGIKNTKDNGTAVSTIFAMDDITIESGIFTAEDTAICIYGGNATINGGTFNSDTYAVSVYGGFLTVNDGQFNGGSCGLYFTEETMFYKTQGKGIVYGGIFNGGISIVHSDDFYLLDAITDGYGVFVEDGTEIIITEMQKTVIGNVTVKESDSQREYVASLTSADGTKQEFVSFDEAYSVAMSKPKSVLTLYKDVEVNNTIYTPTKYVRPDFTFDLNGFTVSGSSASYIFGLTKNSRITIKDSVGTGKIINTNESFGSVFSNSGTLIIESGNIISTAKSAIISDNTVVVNGGSISGKEYGINSTGNVTVYDGEISGEKYGLYASTKITPIATLYGGTFIGGIDLNLLPVGYTLANLLAEGHFYYDSEDNNITDFGDFQEINETVIVKNKYPVSVTQPDGTTEYFPTVDEGVDKVNEDFGSTLKLLTDILLNSSLTIGGITLIDLNGKTLEVDNKNEYAVVVEEGALLNIEDSADNGTIGGGGIAVNGGTLNFNGGTVESTIDGIYNNGGSATVNGGAISSGEGYDDIFVEGENTTIVYGGAYEDGFSIGGITINEALADGYVFYNGDGAIEIEDNQKVVNDNVVVYEKTIVTAMSSQIRFNRNDDGSYAGTFDVRTRAKISDADFTKYIADTNEEAIEKISKVGFVYSTTETEFDIESAKTVAQGGKDDGFADAPVNFIQDADGYYAFTCMVTGITEEYLDSGLIAYAYICVDGTWYFFPVEVTAEFGELYGKYYPMAAEQYGWEV